LRHDTIINDMSMFCFLAISSKRSIRVYLY